MIKSMRTCGIVTVAVCVFGAGAFGGAFGAPNVLLLGDGGSERQVERALESAGHNVVFGGFHYDWDGVDPNVNDFDVVVYLDGYDYGDGLQPTADTAVSAFVAGGGGLVITEWSTFDVYHGNMSPGIAALMPVTSPAADYDYGNLWTVLDRTHLLAAWVPQQWADGAGYSYVVPHANATVVVEGAGGTPLVTYRTDTVGTVVHVNHDLTYTTSAIHPNALHVLTNAVEFAAGLTLADCNSNDVPDFLDVENGDGTDVNGNRVLDECDPDCNENGVPDDLDVLPGTGFTQVEFEFDVTMPTEWDYVDSCDDCVTDEVALGFPVTLGGVPLARFVMSSDGYVELLRTDDTGDTGYDYGYGSVSDLTRYGTPNHTYLMGAYDDLDSGYVGGYGYRTEPGRVTFYWETQTNEDADNVYMGVSIYQIVLESDGTIQWNFASQGFMSHGYDLFTGVYFGYGVNKLYELTSGRVPERQSWVFTGPTPAYSDDVNFNKVPDECEPDCNGNDLPDDMDVAAPIDPGITEIPFRFVEPGALDWSYAGDGGDSGPVELGFTVTLGTADYVAFQQTSDGCVELLRTGDTPYGYSYGSVDDLIAYTGGVPEDPRHTFLMAAFDDLSSEYGGEFGYHIEAAHIVYYWFTETYSDSDYGRFNEFEIILSDDGSVRWNFNDALYTDYGYDLFTGLYLGHNDQILHEITREEIPQEASWVFTETGLPGGGSADTNGNGIPDECEGQGDMNDDGVVDLDDLPGFLDCLQGPGVPVEPTCQRADFDYDSDVDLEDVGAFSRSFSGE